MHTTDDWNWNKKPNRTSSYDSIFSEIHRPRSRSTVSTIRDFGIIRKRKNSRKNSKKSIKRRKI